MLGGALRDYMANGTGLAGPSASPIGSPSGESYVVSNIPTFGDLPIGSILFPAQKSRSQIVKVDRTDVTPLQHEKKQHVNDVCQAVKHFANNVLLNTEFIDNKKKPKVLISITGGAGAYVIPPAIEPIFSKGLMKAASDTNAWIVTGGTESGVMKAVGDAHHRYAVDNIPCIGIASYNALNNKEILVPLNSKTIEFVAQPGGAPLLNPFHTHFVLVDGHSQMRNPNDVFGHEIEFRADLESYLCSPEKFNIPLLLVVVGGGPGTLKTVYEGIVRKFPVVVLNSTGGVADAISYRIHQKTQPGKIRYDKDEWEAWVKREGARITPEHEKFMTMILEDHEFVRIYDPFSGDSLDKFLFESIFNCDKYGGIMAKMELAVSCNQMEVVADLIAACPPNEKSEYVKHALQFAVQSVRAEIVDGLIERTADRALDALALYTFIFAKRDRWARFYPILSQSTIAELEQRQHKQYSIKQASKRNLQDIAVSSSEISLKDIKSDTASLVPSNTTSLLSHFLDDVFLRSGRIYDYYRTTLSLKLGVFDGSHVAFAHLSPEKLSKLARAKLTDILLWALLMGHADLAKVLWTHTTLPVHTALVASHFCKLLSLRFSNEGTRYVELGAEFEAKALQVLGKMNYKEARAMLCYKYDEFKMNLLEIADLAESKEFTSHPYIQRYVDEMLFQNKYGEVPPSTNMWQIVLCILPLLGFWIYHPYLKDNEKLKSGKYSRFMYYTLPVVKFWSNTLCYVGFIVLCSYVLIVSDPNKFKITGPEILLFIWMASLLIEEISQLLEDGPVQYLSRVSNQIDIFMLSLFVVFFILKLIAASTESRDILTAATDLFVVATIIVYLRLLNMFAFSPQLGPLYFVILQIVNDVAQWLFIFVLFCFGTTVALIVCVKQNNLDPFKPYTEGGSFAVAFYTIVGEYADAFNDLNGSAFGHVILALYALIAQIVLVNLLIAMMGDTFNSVKEDSAKEWRFMRYSLATEYSTTSAVAPPFNLIIMPFSLIFNQWHKTRHTHDDKKVTEKKTITFRRLKSLARKFVEEILDEEKELKKKDMEQIADSLRNSIKQMTTETSQKLMRIEEKVEAPAPRSINNNSQPQQDTTNLQLQLSEIQKSMTNLLLRSPAEAIANTFQVQAGQKLITIAVLDGVNVEIAKKAISEFAPLVSLLQTLNAQAEGWVEVEIRIQSIFLSPSGIIELVNFSTKINRKNP